MRILYVHTRYAQSMGGEDTTVQAEADLMQSKGHEVRVHLFDNAAAMSRGAGKLQAGLSAIYNSASAAEIRRVAEEFRPDVVHVHNFFFAASPSVLRAVKKLNIPLVVTLQNYRLICANALLLRNHKVCELCIHHDFPWSGVKYKCYHDSAVQSAAIGAMAAIHKWTGTWKRTVDLYITPSDFLKKRLSDSSFNASAEKIQVKRNFISDPGMASAAGRKEYFLFVGRLSPEKGVDVLLAAWKNIPAPLIIVGDGPERSQLENKFGGTGNITFAGHKKKEEVLALMKESRALIFPSIWYEGLPLTIIEALATGTPVIGSNLGAISEMIHDGGNGLLFEAGSSPQLINAVEKFIHATAGSQTGFYDNARSSYLLNYHSEKCYERMMSLYEKIIADKRKA